MIKKLTDIKGVGEKIEKSLTKIGIESIGDLVLYVPKNYDKFEDAKAISDVFVGEKVAIEGIVASKPSIFRNGRVPIISCMIQDITGKIRVTWFNSIFVLKKLVVGRKYIFRGKIYQRGNELLLNQPTIYMIEEYDKIKNTMAPIYHITKGIKNTTLRKIIKLAFDELNIENKENTKILDSCIEKSKNEDNISEIEELYNDYLPIEIIKKRNLYESKKAYYHMHFPENENDLNNARKRLVYDEFFLYELGLFLFEENKEKKGIDGLANGKKDIIEKILKNLPYELTTQQSKVLQEVWNDFDNRKRINRLIQGDVGSGKTIVAFLIMMYVAINGFQVAMMAPTEVLAKQHFENLINILNDNDIDLKVEFLSGSVGAKDKKIIKSRIQNGEANIVIGTHAILTSDVEFDNLALIIVDEQQRFGVNQRKILEEKGNNINVIHLSATPIPRTLSLLLFNGLDISRIEEKPNNRLDIKTAIINENDRNKAYKLMIKEVQNDNKCYIICPMIEEDKDDEIDDTNLENVHDYSKKVAEYLYVNGFEVKNSKGEDIKISKSENCKKSIDITNIKKKKIVIEILHGKMKQKEKDKIMQDFYDGNIDILISTTVIEVGIDCKDATVIMVENAENFGLATLHQLRGRVGRSNKQSYCIFVDNIQTDKSKERLKVLFDSNDGFYIADQDLKIRGAGDVFGIKQSGEVDFRIGDIYNDSLILKMAMEDAKMIVKNKDILNKKEYILLKRKLDDYVKNGYTI